MSILRRSNGAAPQGFQPGGTLAREMSFTTRGASTFDEANRSVEAVFAAGTPVRRWGIIETLSMDPAAIDLSRIGLGQVPLLDSHNAFSLEAVLGRAASARIEGGQLVGDLEFGSSERAHAAAEGVKSGQFKGISIGYSVQQWTMISQDDGGVETWRADKWTLLEVSLVSVPADPAAMVRAVASSGLTPDIQTEEDDMTRSAQPAAAAAAIEPNPAGASPAAPIAVETRAAPPSAPATATETPAAPERQPMNARQALELLERAEFFGQRELAERLIRDGRDETVIISEVRAASAAAVQPHAAIGGPRAQIGRDETETLRRGVEDALAIHLGERAEPNEAARPFMSARALPDIAADYVGYRGRLGGFAEREDVLRRAMHSTSDFPILLENAMNRSLRARYLAATPTYRAIAQQRTYMDFRDHISVRDGDFPQLKEVKETGEIVGGTFSESKEKTAVKAYGIQVPFSRQLLVNDNLGAIARVLANRSDAVARFEEETFYAMLLSASGAGPTLLETTRAVFNTTDKTLAATPSVIDNANLGKGRAALRNMKTKDGTLINVTPSILLVGPDKETEAQGVLSPLYAATAANVPLFQTLLSLKVSAQITGNVWYLFSDPSVGANFEWGLLEGYQAPRMRMDEPFGVQGMAVSLEHDFGCGAIDYRFGYRNAGA